MDGGEELVMMSLKYEWHNQKIISWTNNQPNKNQRRIHAAFRRHTKNNTGREPGRRKHHVFAEVLSNLHH